MQQQKRKRFKKKDFVRAQHQKNPHRYVLKLTKKPLEYELNVATKPILIIFGAIEDSPNLELRITIKVKQNGFLKNKKPFSYQTVQMLLDHRRGNASDGEFDETERRFDHLALRRSEQHDRSLNDRGVVIQGQPIWRKKKKKKKLGTGTTKWVREVLGKRKTNLNVWSCI